MPTIPPVRRAVCAAAIAIFICFSAVPAQLSSDEILPSGRKSDGCTLIPDGDIRPCCIIHDQEYYRGGTRDERRDSDKKLYDCVRKKKGFAHKLFAPFIWLGVRIGGLPFLPTSFRWGFGTKEKGYAKKRTASETSDTNP
jgi:hypothetical protein